MLLKVNKVRTTKTT